MKAGLFSSSANLSFWQHKLPLFQVCLSPLYAKKAFLILLQQFWTQQVSSFMRV